MGLFSLALSIVAILLAGFAIFSGLTQEQVDLTQCNVIYTALNNPQATSCDQVCGSEKQCIVAYEKKRASPEDSAIITTQDTLVDCSEIINTGIFEEDEGPDELNTIHRFSLDCVCCDK
jgi:hypothetical protein